MKIRVSRPALLNSGTSTPGQMSVFTDRACVDVEALRAGTDAREQRDLSGFRILEECRRDFGRPCVDHTSEIGWRSPCCERLLASGSSRCHQRRSRPDECCGRTSRVRLRKAPRGSPQHWC